MPLAWTEEMDLALRRYAAERMTANEIGNILGKTKNAVIGRARRLQVALLMPRMGHLKAKPRNPVRMQPSGFTKSIVELVVEKPIRRKSANIGKYTILDLTDHMCRWPTDDNAPGALSFRFCGNQAQDGLPYCGCHAKQAYNVRSR
jgi:GcrA cell cycle regulator